ncbi:hypothetical protein SAMN02910357_02453 [Succinivibrio dextrinosolvens]|uniref:hypothetical protein n=1 Tax=Succinivibrio dextrinosolvens TaxID=83771 RepID=UPI0008ED99DB|nr:hypothetical protein [Succinivibrio dextrinosolvens]SFS89671.1 hypothetical protein SAMN02910357_02453 [Succinivibrio dextrinosolvens]
MKMKAIAIACTVLSLCVFESTIAAENTNSNQSTALQGLFTNDNSLLKMMEANPFVGGQQNIPQQAYPAQTNENAKKRIKGTWSAGQGAGKVDVTFDDNYFEIRGNGKVVKGTYEISESSLVLIFPNSERAPLSYEIVGDQYLKLSDGSVLLKQDPQALWPSQTQNVNQPAPQQNTNECRGWGCSSSNTVPPSTTQTPVQTQPATVQNPLIGKWSTQSPQGTISFVFNADDYICTLNENMTIETGVYQYDPTTGVFNYRVTSGQSMGASGSNKVTINGNQLILVYPNGYQMIFSR